MLVAFAISLMAGLLVIPLSSQPVLSLGIIALLVFPLITVDRLKFALKPAQGVNVSGRWKSKWAFVKKGSAVQVEDLIRLRQIGCLVWGGGESFAVSEGSPFTSYKYRIHAVIRPNRIVEGSWINANDRRLYRGVFLIELSAKSDVLAGEWLGNNAEGIGNGKWHWELAGD